jgi:uncharacterized protein with von Willebrand factor type A (vWA) domain
MSDPRAALRVLDELLWSLRREGFSISTAQALAVVRAVQAVGFDRPRDLREAIGSVVVVRARDRSAFDAAFDRYWALGAAGLRGTLFERLSADGFGPGELELLRDRLTAVEREVDGGRLLVPLLGLSGAFDRLVARAGLPRSIDARSGGKLGYLGHQLVRSLGIGPARAALRRLAPRLAESLGARGQALAAALERELDVAETEAREQVRRAYRARLSELERAQAARRVADARLSELTPDEMADARAAVRRFADRLRGGARVRSRRARQGPIDAHRTLRRAMRTAGVPLKLVRRQPRRRRPKLVLLCDVSDSVRTVAAFLLEFTYAAQERFERTRTFTFVSELEEMTELFESERATVAIDRAWRGGASHSGDNSNYGRVLRTFVARHLNQVDRATTVVILGDGRSNYHDPAPELLDAIRRRVRSLLWLCPEPRGEWSQGDSAMNLYAPRCTATYEVCTLYDLDRAARTLTSRI